MILRSLADRYVPSLANWFKLLLLNRDGLAIVVRLPLHQISCVHLNDYWGLIRAGACDLSIDEAWVVRVGRVRT